MPRLKRELAAQTLFDHVFGELHAPEIIVIAELESHLDHACMTFEQIIAHVPGKKKSERTFGQAPLDKATEYAAEDADVTLRLWMVLKPRLTAERVTTVYETLERPLAPVLANMERHGVKGVMVAPKA